MPCSLKDTYNLHLHGNINIAKISNLRYSCQPETFPVEIVMQEIIAYVTDPPTVLLRYPHQYVTLSRFTWLPNTYSELEGVDATM